MTLAHERTTQFLEGARRERRHIVTPEGVPVTVELADYGERVVALVLDLFIWLVVTAGLNKLLDAMFKTGLASPTWYVGLVANSPSPTYAAGDTTASHAGWTESVSYSNATRPTWTPGAVSGGAVDNSAAKASFTVNATDTIAGAFLADNNTKGGSTGTLYGEGSFATPRSVLSGDSLSVEIDLSAS